MQSQPVTGSGTINSLNAMTWTTAKFMSSATPAGANWQDVYIVAKWTGAGTFSTYNGLFTGSNTSGTDGGIGWIAHSGSVNAYTATKWWDNLYLNGTSSTGASVLPTMASDFVVDFSANSPISVTGMMVGRDRTYSGRGWEGLIGEVIAFNSKLSTADRQKTEGYLAWKWGTEGSLPAAHPYKSAAPTQIGITSVTPSTGPGATTTSVTLAGTDFDVSTPTITIGGEPCTSVSVASAISLTCNTPLSFTAGAKDVVATNSTGTFTLAGGFTYAAPLLDRQQVGSVFQDWRRAESVDAIGSVFTDHRRSESVDSIGSTFTDERNAETVDAIGSVMGVPEIPATTGSLIAPTYYWRFNIGSGIVAAAAVGGRHGLINYPLWVSGIQSNALNYAADTNYTTFPTPSTYFSSATYTISMWINRNSDRTYAYFLNHSSNDPSIDSGSSGSGYVRYIINGSQQFNLNSGTGTGVWYHLCIVSDGSDVHLYINGALIGSKGSAGPTPVMTTAVLSLGAYSASYGCRSKIDDFAIWDGKGLSTSEVGLVYGSGTPPDLTTGITGGVNPTMHYLPGSTGPPPSVFWFD